MSRGELEVLYTRVSSGGGAGSQTLAPARLGRANWRVGRASDWPAFMLAVTAPNAESRNGGASSPPWLLFLFYPFSGLIFRAEPTFVGVGGGEGGRIILQPRDPSLCSFQGSHISLLYLRKLPAIFFVESCGGERTSLHDPLPLHPPSPPKKKPKKDNHQSRAAVSDKSPPSSWERASRARAAANHHPPGGVPEGVVSAGRAAEGKRLLGGGGRRKREMGNALNKISSSAGPQQLSRSGPRESHPCLTSLPIFSFWQTGRFHPSAGTSIRASWR